MRTFTRNSVALLIASLAVVVAVIAPVMAVVAIWAGDVRWVKTAGALLALALVLLVVGYLVFEAEVEEE